ncbi:Acyl carrier protein [Rubripirellula obstinata]|uniref:Acyl carrier protein n=1 Tax=Rubripirellula obstinata TaxID=406547 RepID=A0A5B1CD61_9BACT|nr:acyl carrier protein [Rubripirellula obstinata]KAA1257550.1 Acyl carrier protein [Rubripirellula obstinata]
MEHQPSRPGDGGRYPTEIENLMELDTVEFVMTVEERFATSIPDADAERIQTVGDLCDCLAKRVRLFRDSSCPTATSFYRLRRILNQYQSSDETLRPSDSVAHVLPPERRASAWSEIRDEFGTAPPSLRWHPMLTGAFCVFVLLVTAVHVVLFVSFVESLASVLAIGFSASFSCLAGYAIAARCARVIPQSVSTIGELAQAMASQARIHVTETIDDIDDWIYKELVDCVCLCSDAKPDLVSRDTHFVRDLY